MGYEIILRSVAGKKGREQGGKTKSLPKEGERVPSRANLWAACIVKLSVVGRLGKSSKV